MILLSDNLRLAAAYVFEKRNRSPVPVMMISLILFFTEIPVSKYASSFRLWTSCRSVATSRRFNSILALESLYRSVVCGIPSIRDHEP